MLEVGESQGANIIELKKTTTSERTPIISLENVSKRFLLGRERIDVLIDCNLVVFEGDWVSIMGPSGTGKSTLLNLISGLDRPDRGRIKVNGQDLLNISKSRTASWRSKNIGFVFQFYHLLSSLSAKKNVEVPLYLGGMKRKEREIRTNAALSLVGMESRTKHRPNELSGGERQRVAIARAIVSNPPILLCDEPTGDLNKEAGREVMSLLGQLSKKHGRTLVVVTHDPMVAEMADHVFHLADGNLN